jgi:hypothetical protein
MIKMKIELPKDGSYGQTRTQCPHCEKILTFYSTLTACGHCSLSLPNMRSLKFNIEYRVQWHRRSLNVKDE